MQHQSDKDSIDCHHDIKKREWVTVGDYEVNYLLGLVVIGFSIPMIILQNWLLILPALLAFLFTVRRKKDDGQCIICDAVSASIGMIYDKNQNTFYRSGNAWVGLILLVMMFILDWAYARFYYHTK